MINIKKIATQVLAVSIILTSQAGIAKPLLWGTNVSPFVRKVQVVLEEKNISYDQNEILPKVLNDATGAETPKEFLEASYFGKVPALVDGKFKIADSAVISAYLEKKYPSKRSIYPKKAENYARALWFEQYGDNVLASVATKKIFVEKVIKPQVLKVKPDMEVVNKAINEELPPILEYLDKEVSKRTWLAGNSFSIADIAVATHFVSLKQAGYELDTTKYPNLAKYLNTIFKDTAFKNHQ